MIPMVFAVFFLVLVNGNIKSVKKYKLVEEEAQINQKVTEKTGINDGISGKYTLHISCVYCLSVSSKFEVFSLYS